ncbi:MAG: quinolinate synthase NadA [Crocinitomicaceae bacterium]
MTNTELRNQIKQLKKDKKAVILAHYYQEEAIQEVADFVGDSYSLALKAANTDAEIIVFAGVHFMAETAKILNPTKKVLLPDLNAGCSLADSCEYDDFLKFKALYPNHLVVTYINCSAEIKSLTDIVCTSSNAERIINSIPKNKEIIFAPDLNLGKYLIKQTGRDLVLWEGACIVHESFSFEKLLKLINENPGISIVAHPESTEDVLELAEYIGSTSGLIDYVVNSPKEKFIVATEIGILHEMQQKVPNKTLIPAPAVEDNTCACSECAYMKVNTLQKLYDCLKNESPSIELSEELISEARIPINRMIDLTENEKVF